MSELWDSETREIIYTEANVRQKIEDIYKEFPYLRDRQLTSDCKCCEEYDVADEYGYAAGAAWRELDTWKWLLGEK